MYVYVVDIAESSFMYHNHNDIKNKVKFVEIEA